MLMRYICVIYYIFGGIPVLFVSAVKRLARPTRPLFGLVFVLFFFSQIGFFFFFFLSMLFFFLVVGFSLDWARPFLKTPLVPEPLILVFVGWEQFDDNHISPNLRHWPLSPVTESMC
jgi:hypothetical protein